MEKLPLKLRNRAFATLAAFGLAAAMTACGGDPEETDPVADPPAAGEQDGAAGEDVTMDVLAPADGDTVTSPFELVVDADVDLGAMTDELHHLHVWFGDDQTNFELYESETVQIGNAPDGETTMWVQVHTFDHQPASEPTGLSLNVEGGAASDGDGGEEEGDPGYGDY